MPRSRHPGTPVRRPTPYVELNHVLDALLKGVRERLADNFVGLYLQGSFAIGDADEASDCDFIAVTRRDLTDEEIAVLQAMHGAIHELPHPAWRGHLEGSYVPADILRRWSTTPRDPPGAPPRPHDWADPGLGGAPPRAYPLVYLDHGARTLVRSEHDNTQVVRWTLRERGVVLAGPDPRTLIDFVSAADLRAEVRPAMDLALGLGLEPMTMVAWQAFWVGLYCRMLHTLATGVVHSKAAGAAWAVEHADRTAKSREAMERVLEARRQGAKGPHGGPTAVAVLGPRPGRFASNPIRPGGRGRRG